MSNWRTAVLLLPALALPLRAGTLAQFRTTVGSFDVELYDSDKPVTVQNFIRYVTNGLYGNMIFHRIVTNFIVQGGGIFVSNRFTTNWNLYYIPTFPPIVNEFNSGKFYSNVYGTIAMAKASDPNSATSQFFFNLANNAASLDNTNNSGGFTVFGRVVGGTNSLNAFLIGPTNRLVKEVSLGFAPLTELPVTYSTTGILYDTNLIYVDISLLQVEIALGTNGSRNISWISVSNRINYVEFTTNLPPSWQAILNTNGNGNRLTVTDTNRTASRRFYRVRVAY